MTTILSTLTELTIAHAGDGSAHHHGEGALIAALLVVALAVFLARSRA
jgi:hypothetical protein